jgi:hypothetical protein
MKKFLFLYVMPPEAMEDAKNAGPNAREETMKQWQDWADRLGEHLIDLGNPAMPGQRFGQDGSRGSSNTETAGYSLVTANDLEEAKGYLKEHPHLVWSKHTSIDIHELMPM